MTFHTADMTFRVPEFEATPAVTCRIVTFISTLKNVYIMYDYNKIFKVQINDLIKQFIE